MIAWLFVIVAFFVLAIQLFITIIEFKLTALAGFVLVPFALWNRTSFLAERVLGNVVSSGIKVMVLAVIVGIGSGFFDEFATAAGGAEPDLDPGDEPGARQPRPVRPRHLRARASPRGWWPARRSSARAPPSARPPRRRERSPSAAAPPSAGARGLAGGADGRAARRHLDGIGRLDRLPARPGDVRLEERRRRPRRRRQRRGARPQRPGSATPAASARPPSAAGARRCSPAPRRAAARRPRPAAAAAGEAPAWARRLRSEQTAPPPPARRPAGGSRRRPRRRRPQLPTSRKERTDR